MKAIFIVQPGTRSRSYVSLTFTIIGSERNGNGSFKVLPFTFVTVTKVCFADRDTIKRFNVNGHTNRTEVADSNYRSCHPYSKSVINHMKLLSS